MNLFDETENKYYELLTCLLRDSGKHSHQEITELLEKYFPGDSDFEVTEALFATDEGSELVFMNAGDYLEPVLEQEFPIRNSAIEKQAARSLVSSPYVRHFLNRETIDKLKAATSGISEEWSPADITVKNIFADGVSAAERAFASDITTITKAIRDGRAIQYDNIRPGHVKKEEATAFPVKIEFSVVNDRFRINAYEPSEQRFIKMNLDTMRNIVMLDEETDLDLEAEYREFLKLNTKRVVLNVEPTEHVIERCFRVFSYYDRKAEYDREENKYRLEISYLRTDEKEVIKNILSMGSHVVVIEPVIIRQEVYRRILAASRLYD